MELTRNRRLFFFFRTQGTGSSTILVKLFLIVFICIAALGLVLGIAIGFNLSEGQRCVGDLVIAPGDEDADHYMFLDLAKSPETLAGKERVMLNIKMIRTRK